MKTRKLWLSLGAAAVSFPAAPGYISPTLAQAHVHGGAASNVVMKPDMAPGMGGETGEDSVAKADADARLDPAVRFYRDIQLVRGHILVGNELVKAGLWADALPHFLHPVEELYDGLAAPLRARKGKPFLQQLKVLAQTVKAKNEQAYDAALASLNAKLNSIDTGLKIEKADWMPFVVDTALETMRSAIGEYTSSIQDGHFAKAVEYQDSRGFVYQADLMLASVTPMIAAKDPSVSVRMQTGMTALKAAWPTPVPPAAVVDDASKVAAHISKLELVLGNLK